MVVDHVSTATLAEMAAPYNPRRISPHDLEALRRSLRTFGAVEPVVVNRRTDRIVGGHQRVCAAEAEGIAALPVVYVDLDEPAEKQLNLALNRISGEWDEALLGALLRDLEAECDDLALTGFTADEIAELTAEAETGKTDPDYAPEPPAKPVTRRGDLIMLGRHRLLCGDATSGNDVARLCGGVRPILMVTDPPYGVDYEPGWRMKAGVSKNHRKMGAVRNDDRADWRQAWALFSGAGAYVWHAGIRASVVHESLVACGFEIRSQIIWAKDRFALSRGNYHWQHEPCWYAVRKGSTWAGDRKQSTLWAIPAREDGGHGHGTQKPVECMRRPILNNSSPGQAVYDPFVGSGTTIIAAEMTGRACYALEIDPAYCDVVVQRWQEFTGKAAEGWRGNGRAA